MYMIISIAVAILFGPCKGVSAFLPGFDAREATIDTVQNDLFSGLTTCRGIVSSFLARVEAINPEINAIIALNPAALVDADLKDDTLATGNSTGSLFCVPILLKDNFDTRDMPTTGGCLALADSQPGVDAPTVRALRRAGAVILGKVNLHELALEGLSVSSFGGQTINPYDHTRTPGGSSGGSAAAVAASLAVFATGTDTVNSLRSPASANCLFSIRPTRGLITRAGIIPISYTQDAVGAIGRCIKDLAIALTVMSSVGFDKKDNTTALVPAAMKGVDYAVDLASLPLKGLRFGVLQGLFNRTTGNETAPVNDAMDAMTTRLSTAGATIVPIKSAVYNSTAILALDTQRYEYREELTSYLSRPTLGGTHPSSMADLYLRANGSFVVIPAQYEYIATALRSSTSNTTYASIQQAIGNLASTLTETFSKHNLDAVLYPQQANLVVPLGSPYQRGRNGILAALTGSPVVTVPIGFSPGTDTAPIGIPIGMEILGPKWSEKSLLQIGWQVERLGTVRKAPRLAKRVVESKDYATVPVVRPLRNVDERAYPRGTLH